MPTDVDKMKNILIISAAQSLHGTPISPTIEHEWATKASPEVQSTFNNVGFDFTLNDANSSLADLRRTLHDLHWDGVVVGWCIRGMSVERTEIFEAVMREIVDASREQRDLKAMFCRGPTDLVEATLRSFPA